MTLLIPPILRVIGRRLEGQTGRPADRETGSNLSFSFLARRSVCRSVGLTVLCHCPSCPSRSKSRLPIHTYYVVPRYMLGQLLSSSCNATPRHLAATSPKSGLTQQQSSPSPCSDRLVVYGTPSMDHMQIRRTYHHTPSSTAYGLYAPWQYRDVILHMSGCSKAHLAPIA